MKAVLMTATGTPDVLELQDIAEPEIIQATQVKIKLYAAGVNPIDAKLRKAGVFYSGRLLAVLGCDGAGKVVSVGKSVTKFKPGDRVWFCHGGLGQEQGNYAEYNVLDQRWVNVMPSSIPYTSAAASPLVLITAWGALFTKGNLQAGQTVLIHAGAGGVGHVAIQLAKIKGARVITTVSSKEKAEFVRSLGADYVVNYLQENFSQVVNHITQGKGADLVIDTVGSQVFSESISATSHFGRLITLLDPSPVDLAQARMRNLLIGFELMLTPMLENIDTARDQHSVILQRCAEWIDSGELSIHVYKCFTLEQAQEAHKQLEAGHIQGKLVLQI